MIYFTSDQHFGHQNILKFQENRTFASLQEMHDVFIYIWNKTVKPNDEIYHLGDFGMGQRNKLQILLNSLIGRKHLIMGNHDKRNGCHLLEGWATVRIYHEMNWQKIKYVLFHYPIDSWNGKNRGAIHLHGHSHGQSGHHPIESRGRRMDIGVDAVEGFKPISIDQVALKMSKIPILRNDSKEGH